jgi:hypothetical protein
MKEQVGAVAQLHSFLNSVLDGVGLLLPQGENLFNRELGGPQSQSAYFTEEKKKLPLLGNRMHKLHKKIPVSTPVTITVLKGFAMLKKIWTK